MPESPDATGAHDLRMVDLLGAAPRSFPCKGGLRPVAQAHGWGGRAVLRRPFPGSQPGVLLLNYGHHEVDPLPPHRCEWHVGSHPGYGEVVASRGIAPPCPGLQPGACLLSQSVSRDRTRSRGSAPGWGSASASSLPPQTASSRRSRLPPPYRRSPSQTCASWAEPSRPSSSRPKTL